MEEQRKAVRRMQDYINDHISEEISIDPFYSDLNISHLRRVIAEVDSGLAKLEEHPLKEE